MPFKSEWLNWKRDTDQTENAAGAGSVSSVSASHKENAAGASYVSSVSAVDREKSLNKPIKKEEIVFKLHTSDKTADLAIQQTDNTDKTTGEIRVLGGHRVETVIWETSAAVIFRDDAGRFWRYLHAYGQAWPVIIGAKK